MRRALLPCLVALCAGLALPSAGAGSTPRPVAPNPGGGPLAPPALFATGDVTYHGGSVMRSVTAYAIYWVPPGFTLSPSFTSFVDGFLADVAAASGTAGNVFSNDTQYFDTSGQIAYSSAFGGSWTDTATPIPDVCSANYAARHLTVQGCTTIADLAAEVSHAISVNGWPTGLDRLYLVLTPPSVGSCYDVGTSSPCAYSAFCGYHYFSGGAPATSTIWANLPFPRLAGVPGYKCDAGVHPNGNADGDAIVNLVSHEYVEAATDPLLDGWFAGAPSGEIADRCQWTFGAALGSTPKGSYNQAIAAGKYRLQQEWSNRDHACVLRRTIPKVTSFSPAAAPEGATVTLNGTRLELVTGVTFGAVPAAFAHVSAARLTAKVPAGAATTPISVTSTDDASSTAKAFVVAPAITGLSAPTGQAGDAVVITGTTLGAATSVAFGAVPDLTYHVDGPTQITAHVPDTASVGPIAVTTPGGKATRAFGVRPRIDAVTPPAAQAAKVVTIDGKALGAVTRVVFGSPAAAGSIRTRSATRLTVAVPSTAVTGKITATNAAGSGDSPGSFTVLPSKLTSFTPTSGVAGTPVAIYGTGLANTTAVTFGGVAAQIVSAGATKVVAQVPPTAPVGTIAVTTAEGAPTPLATLFRPVPRLDVPAAAAQVGDVLTLTGTNLLAATKLTVGTVAIPLQSVAAQQLTTGALPDTAVTGALRVVTPGGTSAAVTLKIRPTVATISPGAGHAGDAVTITGKTLAAATKVTFGGNSPAAILSRAATKLVVRVPSTAVSGPITVTSTGGSDTSAASFTITAPTPYDAGAARSSRPG